MRRGAVLLCLALLAPVPARAAPEPIVVCQHYPISGGAPIDRTPKRFGAFYFDHLNDTAGGVNGRPVTFLTYDDRSNPANAVHAAERCLSAGAHVVVGSGGPDEINAVAKWAHDKGVAYLHGSASAADLAAYETHAWLGPESEDQASALAALLAEEVDGPVFGTVRVASPFHEAPHEAFRAELARRGHAIEVEERVHKDENTFTAVWSAMRSNGVNVINASITPLLLMRMLSQKPPDYHPVLASTSLGVNLVAEIAQGERLVSFHDPSPAYPPTKQDADPDVLAGYPYADEIRRFQEVFATCEECQREADAKTPRDDIDWASYLRAEQLHRLLETVTDFSTEGVLAAVDAYSEDPGDAYPACALDFTAGDRRGQDDWHVLLAGGLPDRAWRQAGTCARTADLDFEGPTVHCDGPLATGPVRCVLSDADSGVGTYTVSAWGPSGAAAVTGDGACAASHEVVLDLPPGVHRVEVDVRDCAGWTATASSVVIALPR